MAKQFFFFIVLIRALAAIVITNSHYTGVYPTDLIANGGLLGDVLFFAVSGFCLASTPPQAKFGEWYLKRFIRVYTPTWLMTIGYIILGAYAISDLRDIVDFFIWPTHWHFVASIILLYIPLYFITKYIEMNVRNYCRVAITLFLIQLLLYITAYDISYYHIDKVREPMIEFLFFQAMLLGVHYRWKAIDREKDGFAKLSGIEIVICFVLFILYFGSKIVFQTFPSFSQYQLLNQLILFSLLYSLLGIFMKFECKLKGLESSPFWTCVKFLADRTLEIYLVQYVILDYCKIGAFPINWIILTFTILAAACILHWVSQVVLKIINNGLAAHRLL